MRQFCLLPLYALLIGLAPLSPGQTTSPSSQETQPPIKLLPRVRPADTVRLGGVYTMGLGENHARYVDAASHGIHLSAAKAKWIADNCDLIALDPLLLTPGVYPKMTTAQPLFTPLLFLDASFIQEKAGRRGSVGGWSRRLAASTLHDPSGREVPYPERGGHWMNCQSKEWATHWRDRVEMLAGKYGAQGVVAAELPIDNPALQSLKSQYVDEADRIKAATFWLEQTRAAGRYLMIPSGLAFDLPAGRALLPIPEGSEEPELTGRLWDQYYSLVDGAWVEGWVHPYWTRAPLSEAVWERQLEAADRAGKLGQVFIAAAAYRNEAELDYALASYLLVVHRQGRVVFQPMPLRTGVRRDAGYSLEVLLQELQARPGYFNVRLGAPEQDRRLAPAEGGDVWKRAFQFGVVYVNSTDNKTITVGLGSPMRRLNGKSLRRFTLLPHNGLTLLYE